MNFQQELVRDQKWYQFQLIIRFASEKGIKWEYYKKKFFPSWWCLKLEQLATSECLGHFFNINLDWNLTKWSNQNICCWEMQVKLSLCYFKYSQKFYGVRTFHVHTSYGIQHTTMLLKRKCVWPDLWCPDLCFPDLQCPGKMKIYVHLLRSPWIDQT